MKIVFLGGGNMASALIGGLLAKGFSATQLAAIEISESAREHLRSAFGVATLADAGALVPPVDALVLAVKPQQMRAALAPLAGRLGGALVVSIAAGLRTADLSRWLGGYRRLVRCMPNTPALIGAGTTGLYADPAVDQSGRDLAQRLLSAVGSVVWVDAEAQLDGVTAISGSGPAYVFHFIEALEAAAAELGLAPEIARRLALDTVLGAARLAVESGDPPGLLRERVTSKGGTTAAALAVLQQRGFLELIGAAVRAAEERSRQLGDELGHD